MTAHRTAAGTHSVSAAAMQARTPELLMLVPHEPTLDPRIHYTANTLAKEYRVTVLATVRDFERRPADNYPSAPLYETTRIAYRHQRGLAAARDFLNLRGAAADGTLARLRARVGSALGLAVASSVFIGLGFGERAIHWRRLQLSGPRPVAPEGALPRAVPAPAGTGLRSLLAISRYALQASGLLWQHIIDNGLRPDIVYCHDLYALQAAVLLKRRTHCPVIYDSHEYFPYQAQGAAYERTVRWYERALVREVDLYLTVSPQLAEELQSVYGVKQVHVFPNVEPRPPTQPKVIPGEMHRLADGRLKILYQGSFAPQRGLEEIVADWSRVDGGRAALFLRGPPNSTLDGLKGLAQESGLLDKSIYVLPPVLERDLITAAAEADIGLIPYKNDQPSYRFACPNKLSQYIHASLAIISNNIPFVTQLLEEHGIGEVYDARQPGSFAGAVRSMYEDPKTLAACRAKAKALSNGDYTWEHYEPRLLDLVRELGAQDRPLRKGSQATSTRLERRHEP